MLGETIKEICMENSCNISKLSGDPDSASLIRSGFYEAPYFIATSVPISNIISYLYTLYADIINSWLYSQKDFLWIAIHWNYVNNASSKMHPRDFIYYQGSFVKSTIDPEE